MIVGRYATFEAALHAYTYEKERYYRVDWDVHKGNYTTEEDEVIMKSNLTIREIARKLGRTVKAIERRRYYLKHGR